MLRPRWLAQIVVFGILCLGGAGLAVALAQISDHVSGILFCVLTFAGSLIFVFVVQRIEHRLIPLKTDVEAGSTKEALAEIEATGVRLEAPRGKFAAHDAAGKTLA